MIKWDAPNQGLNRGDAEVSQRSRRIHFQLGAASPGPAAVPEL